MISITPLLRLICFFCILSSMAIDKPRILLTLPPELLEEIDDYRYENRIPARSEAIRLLLKKALKKYKKSQKDFSE